MTATAPIQRPDNLPLEDAPRTKNMDDKTWQQLIEGDRLRKEELNKKLEEEAQESRIEKG